MLERLVLPAINHLLKAAPWATERLRAHRGAHFRVEAGILAMSFAVDEHGGFMSAGEGMTADVTLTLPADAPLRLFLDRETLFSSVKLSGAADLAETLAFVFRHLDWDAEGDLAALIGDIPARRLVRFGRSLATSLQETLRKSVENLVEYSAEEVRLVVPQREIEGFSAALRDIQDGSVALERRVSLLERQA